MTARALFRKAAHHWVTVAFVLGFITDTILLNQIDNLVDNLILLFYVLLATTAMLLLYMGVAERVPRACVRPLKRFAPILLQYSFGGLLSGMLIFYGRSGDWLASAPFLLLIVAVIFGNELVSKRSDRLIYNIALYYIGLYSYIVLVVPVITGRMGDLVFIFSGLLALLLVSFVIQVLYRIVPNFMMANSQRVIITIGMITLGFNVLYFTNIIPPIPLSLTELEIVQSVDRQSDGNYRVVYEQQPFYRHLPFIRQQIHPIGNSIACYSRVYAPTKLETEIFHRWQYVDESGKWKDHFRLGYSIAGTNKGGYRGYTRVQSFFNGVWRCSVETERGQVLGRAVVVIDTVGPTPETVTQIE